MTYLIHIVILLEMIFINLYTEHICSKKRVSGSAIITVHSLYSVLIIGGGMYLLKDTANYGNGNGLPILLGLTYLLPLKFLYKQPMKYTISVICSAWVYTMFIFSLSVQTARMLPAAYFEIGTLIIQTLLYAVTLATFFRFIKERFLHIIKNADKKNSNTLLLLGLSWFVFIVLLNVALTIQTPHIVKLAVLLLLFGNALATYNLFYSLSRANQSALKLEEAARFDTLTGLNNRKAFFEDAQTLIDLQTPFTVMFIDLDNFKSINDAAGHLAGDAYLKNFAHKFAARFSSAGTMYRISGDEFVYICTNEQTDAIYKKIKHFDAGLCYGSIRFKGLSIGRAAYPSEGDTLNSLISLADERMYRAKRDSYDK